MLGMSFGEMLLISVIALIVVGPRNLPSMMRTLGQWIGRARRIANEMRAQSGIDDILNAEGIHEGIETFRDLASGRVLVDDPPKPPPAVVQDREREYPRVGSDSYGAGPEDLAPYYPLPEAPPAALPPAEASSPLADAAADGAGGTQAPASTTATEAPREGREGEQSDAATTISSTDG